MVDVHWALEVCNSELGVFKSGQEHNLIGYMETEKCIAKDDMTFDSAI